MSRLTSLERHRHSLGEIREIMNSMKTLAYLETRKLAAYLDAQAAVVRNIENAAADLLHFHPDVMPPARSAENVCVLFGSERGFCGDFNHALLRDADIPFRARAQEPRLIAVGRNLHTLLEAGKRSARMVEGASVADEVPRALHAVIRELSALQQELGAPSVYCVYHAGDDGLARQALLPPFVSIATKPLRHAIPPVLNQPPGELLAGLTDHYLFAVLHKVMYASLMAENQRRIAHLDGAIEHLDDESAELARRCNALRQEEIINEIEVILLSAASLGET